MSNAKLCTAMKNKNDEFYTQLTDIERELSHYENYFKHKTVLCNCDDPFTSNFFKYFVLNFNRLGFSKLICTCYSSSPVTGSRFQLKTNGQIGFNMNTDSESLGSKHPYKAIVTKVYDKTGNGGIDMEDIAELFKSNDNELTELQGDGDFRSQECLDLLDEADIVVTNPPFSLFREYVNTLIEHSKKFIIIGNQNAITYEEIFPLIKDNKVWLGYGFPGNVAFFESPYEDVAVSSQHKEGLIRVSGVVWFTNLGESKRDEKLILTHIYNPKEYSRFDNYDAINIDKTSDIPCDYDGVMGVPITFMDKYNPEQFEILGATETEGKGLSNGLWYSESNCPTPMVNGKAVYKRIFIRNKQLTKDKNVGENRNNFERLYDGYSPLAHNQTFVVSIDMGLDDIDMP